MLLELAIGDAYGAGFEYADPSFVREHSAKMVYIQNPVYDALRPGRYTDDTQMSIAIAELLIERKEWTPINIANKFVEVFKRDERKGYGRLFQEFLEEIRDGNEFLERIKPESDKSGSAMRASPMGYLPTIKEVIEYATIQAKITHDTESGIN